MTEEKLASVGLQAMASWLVSAYRRRLIPDSGLELRHDQDSSEKVKLSFESNAWFSFDSIARVSTLSLYDETKRANPQLRRIQRPGLLRAKRATKLRRRRR